MGWERGSSTWATTSYPSVNVSVGTYTCPEAFPEVVVVTPPEGSVNVTGASLLVNVTFQPASSSGAASNGEIPGSRCRRSSLLMRLNSSLWS